jgi:hypothetical protein
MLRLNEGHVAERLNAPGLPPGEPHHIPPSWGSVGSNPTMSASKNQWGRRCLSSADPGSQTQDLAPEIMTASDIIRFQAGFLQGPSATMDWPHEQPSPR